MSTLEKAVSQEHLTLDTVDFQFCSDWLKDEIKALFATIEMNTNRELVKQHQEDARLWQIERNQLVQGLERARDQLKLYKADYSVSKCNEALSNKSEK
jgi:hypothetical protein